MKSLFSRVLVPALAVLLVLAALPALAGMRIHLKDGRTVDVSVDPNEIASIEFTPASAVNSPPPKAAPAPAVRAKAGGDELMIVSAIYESKVKSCDATKAVKKVCDHTSKCQVSVSNKLCGDPDPGAGKNLKVKYTCRGNNYALRVDEDQIMVLTCPL